MTKQVIPTPEELMEMDRVYREGGLRQMATPPIHYREPKCPHPECDHRREEISPLVSFMPLGMSAQALKPLVFKSYSTGTLHDMSNNVTGVASNPSIIFSAYGGPGQVVG